MRALRPLRVILACIILVAAVLFAIHAAAQPRTPGASLTWTNPPAPAASPAAPGLTGIPRATATASSGGDGGPLAGLRAPLSAVLQRLNAETARSAAGQRSLLEQLENALRKHIEDFLHWVVGRR